MNPEAHGRPVSSERPPPKFVRKRSREPNGAVFLPKPAKFTRTEPPPAPPIVPDPHQVPEKLVLASPKAKFVFYGNNREFVRYKGSEALLHGPAETGKTISILWKLHLCAITYPEASIVLVRKVRDSIYPTVLRTFTEKVLDDDVRPYVTRFGGEKPEWFEYYNGSRIWVVGMDKPGKVLSAEHDLIYVNQAEELTSEDWETLTTRTTGRAGHMPYAQTIGDANPAYPAHWMYHRATLRIFYSRHEDNPTLYNQVTGELTEQGKKTMAVLDALTGVRKERLRYGRPSQVEGAVYEEWDESIHLIADEAAPKTFRYYFAAQDWGFTNPGVLGVFGVDGDDRMYLVRQVYQTGQTIDWWQDTAVALEKEYGRFRTVECDPSEPAYIAAYMSKGLRARKGNNQIRPGINAVKERLKNKRLFVLRSSLQDVDQTLLEARLPASVQDEFPAYAWANRVAKEEPIQKHDHGMDMVRYAVQWMDRVKGWARGASR